MKVRTINDDLEDILLKYKNKILTTELKTKLKKELHDLVDEWISDTCAGMLV